MLVKAGLRTDTTNIGTKVNYGQDNHENSVRIHGNSGGRKLGFQIRMRESYSVDQYLGGEVEGVEVGKC